MTLRETILAKYPNAWRQLDRVPDRLLAEFLESLDDGTDPVWAEMAVCRCGPGLDTDTAYETADRFRPVAEQFGNDERLINERMAAAKAQGVSVTRNHVWLDFLAKSPTDPEAWAAPGQVRSTIKKLAEKRGIELDGAVKVKGRERPPAKPRPIGRDIVSSIAREEAKSDPSFLASEKKMRDKYESIVEDHSPR